MNTELPLTQYLSITLKEIRRKYPGDENIAKVSRLFSFGMNHVPVKVEQETREYLLKYQDNIIALVETQNHDLIVIDEVDIKKDQAKEQLIPGLMAVIKKYMNENSNHGLYDRLLKMLEIAID